MLALPRLLFVELKLLLRDAVSPAFAVALPLAYLLIFGLTAPRGTIGTFLPSIEVTIALGMVGFFTLPGYLASYREKGILRRLATTPLHPAMLLITQMVLNLLMALTAVGLVIAVGNVVLGIAVPANILGFLAALLLGVSAMSSLGLLIAAVAPSGRTASALGPLLFFPCLFFAGAWIPRAQMPEILAQIGVYTPLGAAQDMLQSTWAGSAPQLSELVITGVITLVLGAVAVRLFRWE